MFCSSLQVPQLRGGLDIAHGKNVMITSCKTKQRIKPRSSKDILIAYSVPLS